MYYSKKMLFSDKMVSDGVVGIPQYFSVWYKYNTEWDMNGFVSSHYDCT